MIDKRDLATELARRHGIGVEDDPAPALCRAYGFQTIYDMPMDLQLAIRSELLERHRAQLRSRSDRVFSFSAVEWAADWMRWAWGSTPAEKWALTMDAVAECVAAYDTIIHLDDGPRRAYDGYVWFDMRNAEQVNGVMKYLYRELRVESKVDFMSGAALHR